MTTVKTDIDAEIDQRQLVTTYEDCGCGPQALAIVVLLDVPFPGTADAWSAMGKPGWVRMYSHNIGRGGRWWSTRERAAIAYCLDNSIPLDPLKQESDAT